MAKLTPNQQKTTDEQKTARLDAINGNEKFKAAILRESADMAELRNLLQQAVAENGRVSVYNGRRGTRVSITFQPLVIPEPTSPKNASDL